MSYETQNLELPPGDYGVNDIAEADSDLMRRQSDGLTVTLWYVKATSSAYITVENRNGLAEGEEPVPQFLQVPKGHNPLNGKDGMFYHPNTYLPTHK